MLEDTHDIIAVVLFVSHPSFFVTWHIDYGSALPYLLVFLLSVQQIKLCLPILATVHKIIKRKNGK